MNHYFHLKACDHELLSEQVNDINRILEKMREKIDNLEESKHLNSYPKPAPSEDFSIDGSVDNLKSKGKLE